MRFCETVILPISINTKVIAEAARLFSLQYHCLTHIEMQGNVLTLDYRLCRIPDWRTIVILDHEISLLGIGSYGDDADDLLWLFPTDSGRIRLSPLLKAESQEDSW